MVRLVTGGTGFIGRHLLRELAKRDGDTYVLVRQPSRARLERLIGSFGAADRMRAVAGDITAPGLGLPAADQDRLRGADIYHLAAVYDLEASDEANERANVGGTRNVVALAEQLGARLHHVSSIAVAGGKCKGKFTEDMFEAGQALDHPYYKTKYEAESLVRASGVPYRIYRPGLVIGSSETGRSLPHLPARPCHRLVRDGRGRPHRRSVLRVQAHPAPSQRHPSLGAARGSRRR